MNTPAVGNPSNPERRELMITGLRIATSFGLGAAFAWAKGEGSNNPVEHTRTEVGLPSVTEFTPEKFPSIVDAATAAAVTAAFADHVFVKGVYKGDSLGMKSAMDVGGLALARVAALHMTGNHEAGHLADEEWAEIEESMALVPVLVMLSDLSSTQMKVNVNEVFNESLLKKIFPPETHEPSIKRPSLTADKAEWQEYLTDSNKRLVEKTSEVVAVSSVLAPLATTYASSALANRMKEEVMEALYEQSLALTVLAQMPPITVLEVDPEFDKHVHATARKRTDEHFNGPWGFTHLVTALSANIHGATLAGDPPEFFALARHKDKPELLAKAHVTGAVISEVSSIALPQLWLSKVMGAKDSLSFTPSLVLKQTESVLAVVETGAVLKDVSLNDGQGQVDGLIAALESTPGKRDQALIDTLKKFKKAKLQLSMRKYVKGKIKILEKLVGVSGFLNAQDLEKFDYAEAAQGVLGSAVPAGSLGAAKLMDAYHLLRSEKATELAELMTAMVEEGNATNGDAEMEDALPVDAQSHKLLAAKAFIDELMDANHLEGEEREHAFHAVLKSVSGEKSLTRSKLRSILAIFEETPSSADVQRQIAMADGATLKLALEKFVDVDFVTSEPEDVIPGHEGEVPTHAEEGKFLSHAATEVLGALGTQIPAVPALKRSVKLSLDFLDNAIKDPDTLTIVKCTSILMSEILISAFADNVAAYLYAEGGIMDQVKTRFGANIFEKKPQLEEIIVIISLKLAETAGALSKFGNGPNFSQDKIELMEAPDDSRGYTMNRVNMPVTDTIKNGFAYAANGIACVMGAGMLANNILEVSAEEKKTA